jgi:TetR/AcrR family transcriptional regulator, transcriptional repressor of aconitase
MVIVPKVSEEHLERRREQILQAAQSCFGRKGFHETSMQDVFAESGLSAGAVYRYFKSKDGIIKAIAERSLERIEPVFEKMLAEDPIPPVDEAVTRLVTALCELEDGPMRIAPQAWAAAIYDPGIAEFASGFLGRIRSWWIELAHRQQAAGRMPPDADADAVGAVLFGLIPGFVYQRLLLGDVDPDTFRRGIRGLVATTL